MRGCSVTVDLRAVAGGSWSLTSLGSPGRGGRVEMADRARELRRVRGGCTPSPEITRSVRKSSRAYDPGFGARMGRARRRRLGRRPRVRPRRRGVQSSPGRARWRARRCQLVHHRAARRGGGRVANSCTRSPAIRSTPIAAGARRRPSGELVHQVPAIRSTSDHRRRPAGRRRAARAVPSRAARPTSAKARRCAASCRARPRRAARFVQDVKLGDRGGRQARRSIAVAGRGPGARRGPRARRLPSRCGPRAAVAPAIAVGGELERDQDRDGPSAAAAPGRAGSASSWAWSTTWSLASSWSRHGGGGEQGEDCEPALRARVPSFGGSAHRVAARTCLMISIRVEIARHALYTLPARSRTLASRYRNYVVTQL